MNTDCFKQNEQKIAQKLAWLQDKPAGVLFEKQTSSNHILILKKGTQIQMYFTDAHTQPDKAKLSGIMSRIDLNDPLNLLGLYTQAMMLTLLFQSEPKNVFVLGFGGGRIPLLFHHYFPECHIESVEIDEDVIQLAGQYFGVDFDNRQMVAAQDGREYLEGLPEKKAYDILIVDAFTDSGSNPLHLNTKEFYTTCSRHLEPNGVICINLVTSDSLFLKKVNTFHESFRTTYVFEKDDTYTLFGTNGQQQEIDELLRAAEKMQNNFRFPFPFVELVQQIHPFDSLPSNPNTIGSSAPVLIDAELQ